MIKCSDIINSCCHNPNIFANNPGNIYADGRIVCSKKCSNSTGHPNDCCYLCTEQCNTASTRKENEFVIFCKIRALQKAQQKKVSK